MSPWKVAEGRQAPGAGWFLSLRPVVHATRCRRLSKGGHRTVSDRDVLIILLGDGTKKGQNADIQRAKQCWRDYKTRKKR